MSRLVRLYPAAWRERYEAELRAALATRPLTRRDRLDLVRGALDARLHPELGETPSARVVTAGSGVTEPWGLGWVPFPVVPFLWAVAAGTLALAAGLILFRASGMWGSMHAESVLVTVAALALGAAFWVQGSGAPVVRLGGAVMIATALTLIALDWYGDHLTGAAALGIGGVIVAFGVIVHRRARWFDALALLALTGGLDWAVQYGTRRWLVAVLVGYGIVALRLSLPRRGWSRRHVAWAMGAGIGAVAIVMGGLAVSDPWSGHDGYSVGCHVDRARCLEVADRMAAAMRAHPPGMTVTAIEVREDGQVWACWRDVRGAFPGGCRLGEDDGWPATTPAGSF